MWELAALNDMLYNLTTFLHNSSPLPTVVQLPTSASLGIASYPPAEELWNSILYRQSSDLFATSSHGDVRVWHADTGKELLRLSTPNITCHAVVFTPDGKGIITGNNDSSRCHNGTVLSSTFSAWDDGKIRAFYPQSGKPMYTIHDAHNKGVTALACTSDSHTVVSGGGEGQVRVWGVNSSGQHMKAALKEHTGTVTCIKLRTNNEEVCTRYCALMLARALFPHCSVLQQALMAPASSGT